MAAPSKYEFNAHITYTTAPNGSAAYYVTVSMILDHDPAALNITLVQRPLAVVADADFDLQYTCPVPSPPQQVTPWSRTVLMSGVSKPPQVSVSVNGFVDPVFMVVKPGQAPDNRVSCP